MLDIRKCNTLRYRVISIETPQGLKRLFEDDDSADFGRAGKRYQPFAGNAWSLRGCCNRAKDR